MHVVLPHEIGIVSALTPAGDILGECPVWSAGEQALYWIDVRAPAVRRLEMADGTRRDWNLPELVGCMALKPSGDMILGLRTQVALLNAATESLETVARLHGPDGTTMRLNDGKCDRQGRFWVGSMDDVGRGPVGRLYRVEAGRCEDVAGGVSVPNSMCWSPDGTTMYFADGAEPVIWAYPFDVKSGSLGERREFTRREPGTGIPDGATVDAEGFLWSANYGGGCVTRYTSSGEVAEVFPMPVMQPSSCAFGGPDMDILFVTTASQRLTPEALAAQPLAGALLAMRTATRGLQEPEYTG